MAQVMMVCENPKCGERWMSADKPRSGNCQFCRAKGGKEAVEESYNEVKQKYGKPNL